MKTSLLIIIILLLGNSSFGQDEDARQGTALERDLLMRQYILDLKEGILLVRLHTQKNTLEALKQRGQNAAADKIAAEQAQENLEIVKAFKDEFTFCPVYFFYSDESKALKAKDFGQVHFLDSTLQVANTKPLSEKHFLTAEFGTLSTDTVIYPVATPGDGEGGQKIFFQGSTNDISALLVMNDELTQLQRPFPFYVRIFKGLPFERKKGKAVKRLDQKLNRYYEEVKS